MEERVIEFCIENLTRNVFLIQQLLPQQYTYGNLTDCAIWQRNFSDGTSVFIRHDFNSNHVHIGSTESDEGTHRDIESLPELAAVALRMIAYGKRVTGENGVTFGEWLDYQLTGS